MNRKVLSVAILMTVLAAVAGAGTLASHNGNGRGHGRVYEVTITNMTRGQVVTPPVVAIHRGTDLIFTPGQPASPELELMAEEGLPVPLMTLLQGDPRVADVVKGPGVLLPGESVTVEVRGFKGAWKISAAAMLASSNDAFFALNGAPLSRNGKTRHYDAPAYDAGSEGNSESCAHVPGPPCSAADSRNTATAEGFVHVHPGIHGIADLDPAEADWRNPVVRVSVRKIRG